MVESEQMGRDQSKARGASPQVNAAADTVLPLPAALAAASESDRYRLLSALLFELAETSADGRTPGSEEELATLSRKVNALAEEKASLQDKYAGSQADLEHRTTQLGAEQTRGHQLQLINEEQGTRLDALQQQVTSLESQMVARAAELHKAHGESDRLLLETQRAELKQADRSKLDRLEASRRELNKEVEALRSEMEQLRIDKDAEIVHRDAELADARSLESGETGISFEELWARLAAAKPALVDGHVKPTKQGAERLMDAFIELVRFVDDFDKLVRPFLSKYTKHHPPVQVPWDVYARRDDTLKTIQQTFAAGGGKPIGVVKIRLRGLYAWTEAAMIACDAAIESVASELHEFLMGPNGAGSDPNRTIRGFLRDDGHELFLQHIRELRGVRLAETFGRRG